MSKSQNTLPANGPETAFPDAVPERGYELVTTTDAESYAGSENGADFGGHTLLARPPAQQGRKSLFRR